MTRTSKVLVLAAVIIVGLPLFALGVYILALVETPSLQSGPRSLTSCAKEECGPELVELRRAILHEDATASIQKLDYYHAGFLDGTSDKLTVQVASSRGESFADKIAELAWKSEIAPMNYVYVTVSDMSGKIASIYPKKYDFITQSYERDGEQHPFVSLYGERRKGQLSQ